jgi:hypothetical protein
MNYTAWIAPVGVGVLLVVNSCGGDTHECGPGTVLSGNQCVAVAATVSDAGGVPDSSVVVTAEGGIVYRPLFAGINSIAPVSDSGLVVTWRAATDSVTPRDQLVYRIYVATTKGGEDFTKPRAVSQPGATSMLLIGLTTTDYFAVVRAVNADGVEDLNTVEKSGKPKIDTVPPQFGGLKTATGKGPASVELTWDAAKDDGTPAEGITYVAHWSADPNDAPTGTFGGVSEAGATSMIVSGLTNPITGYYFVVNAVDAAGNAEGNITSQKGTTTEDTSPPHFAGCQSVFEQSAGGATVAWLPAQDDSTTPDKIVYTVYASETPIGADGGGFDLSHSAKFTGGVTGRLSGLTQGTRWYFLCRAEDASGNQETNTALRSAQTQSDHTPPHFNGITSATLLGYDKAHLTWEPGTDDQTPPSALRYAIFTGDAPGKEAFDKPTFTPPGATSFDIAKLSAARTYVWVVRAQDEGMNPDTNVVERGLTTPDTISFVNVVAPIFTHRCISCHRGATAPMGLDLQKDFAFGLLVNHDAQEDQPISDAGSLNVDDSGAFDASGYIPQYRKRIKPGEPENSYLYLKVTGRPPVGNPMPPPSTGIVLDGSEVDAIKNWILQGALDN